MRRRILSIALICLFLIGGIFGAISCAEKGKGEVAIPEEPAPPGEVITITVEEFLEGGPSNKYLASQYFYKIFQVSGIVETISSSYYHVELGPSKYSDRVHCLFDSEEAKNLREGQRVIIQGELVYPYPGLEGPTLQHCKIVSKK